MCVYKSLGLIVKREVRAIKKNIGECFCEKQNDSVRLFLLGIGVSGLQEQLLPAKTARAQNPEWGIFYGNVQNDYQMKTNTKGDDADEKRRRIISRSKAKAKEWPMKEKLCVGFFVS